ncbi:MAG: rRNA maturation RNase YbeY [Mariprofundaceae bacterium]|nr:rRNA maturation RNase YbeY [Mariprofundaceae bacterium]
MIELIIDDDVDDSIPPHIVHIESIQEAFQTTFQCLNITTPIEPEICIRFASNTSVQKCNAQWRNQDKVTDVLSFPMQEANVINFAEPLGDMMLAWPFVLQEAQALQRDVSAHQRHLMIHSLLHLLGYDHIQDDDAMIMQSLECRIMKTLGLHNPYPELTIESCSPI